jgi:hypothetical protein
LVNWHTRRHLFVAYVTFVVRRLLLASFAYLVLSFESLNESKFRSYQRPRFSNPMTASVIDVLYVSRSGFALSPDCLCDRTVVHLKCLEGGRIILRQRVCCAYLSDYLFRLVSMVYLAVVFSFFTLSLMIFASGGSLRRHTTRKQLHSARGSPVQTQIDKKGGANTTHPTYPISRYKYK